MRENVSEPTKSLIRFRRPWELDGNPIHPEQWGGWVLNMTHRTLTYAHYEIDLDSCTTSAQVLDWMAQISHKTWATPTVLAGLVKALDHLLNLQATLCSWGYERGPIIVKATIEAQWAKRRHS